MEEGVEEIGREAFYGCSMLSDVYMPRSLEKFSADSFDGDVLLTIWCYKDSYAYEYAQYVGIKYQMIE
jgi:hypothetical protein